MIRILLAFLIGIIAALYGIYATQGGETVAAVSQQQAALAVRAEYYAHIRGQVFQWSLLVLFVAGLVGAIWRWLYVPAINDRERIPVDKSGMYPELVRDVTPLHRRLLGERKMWAHNPNMVVAPNVYATLNGKMTVEASTDGISAEQQLDYARDSWSVQRTAAAATALAKPNATMMKALAGVFDWQARQEKAKAEATMGRTPQIVDAGEPQEMLLSPRAALERSQNGIVYIGQQKTGRNALAAWDTNGASTLGIFGANGTGKSSSVAMMVTLAMVRWGWRLWILDGKDSGDWDNFGDHAEVVPVAQHNIEDSMQAIWEEYQRREAVMQQYRARHYRHLPPDVQSEFPQWGVVFEEFGATRLALRSKTRTQLDKFLGILCQKARYTGWHGVFIDQRPSDYTDEMKGNLKSIVCFKLLMNQGHAVNAYHASRLADLGEFEMDGNRYWAFHAEPIAPAVLAGVSVSQPFVPRKPSESPAKAYESPVPEAKGETFRANGEDDDTETLVSIYERSLSWDAVAEKFFAQDADRKQADLRRLMVQISNDGRGTSAFTGEAHRLYHLYNPNGKHYQTTQTLSELKDEMTLEELQALGVGLEAIEIDRDKYGAARLYTTNGAH